MKALTHLTPEQIRAPFARYSHGVSVHTGARILFCSGQLGIDPNDEVPESARAQARLCFTNIAEVLAADGMGAQDVVRLTAYVTSRAHLGAYMEERDRFMEGVEPPPASTLIIVTGFARDAFKLEVEAIAAKGA